jgi:hypothetical protein
MRAEGGFNDFQARALFIFEQPKRYMCAYLIACIDKDSAGRFGRGFLQAGQLVSSSRNPREIHLELSGFRVANRINSHVGTLCSDTRRENRIYKWKSSSLYIFPGPVQDKNCFKLKNFI